MSEYHEKINVFRGNIPNIQELRTNPTPELEAQFLSYKQEIESSKLVPGDIIEIRDSFKIPCDLILLQGRFS